MLPPPHDGVAGKYLVEGRMQVLQLLALSSCLCGKSNGEGEGVFKKKEKYPVSVRPD